MTKIKQLPEEVCNNNKYTCLEKLRKKSLLHFWYLICKGLAWTKFSKIEMTF